MNAPDSFIDTYDLKEVHADVGEESQIDGLFVFVGEEIHIKDKMFHPQRSTHFSLHLNLGEDIEMKYNLIDYKLKKNTLFIIQPGLVHHLKAAIHLPTVSMGFTHEFFGEAMLYRKHEIAVQFLPVQNDPLFTLTDSEAQQLHRMMLYLKGMLNNTEHPFREEMIHLAFSLFILELMSIAKKYRNAKEQGITRKEDILFAFLKKLAEHFKEERSVQFYADALFITPKHLTKTVKELTTRTCGDFIDEMVITEAKILLGELSYSVAQVADELHFSDQFFFSKFFKRSTGLSPKEYKNTL